MKRKSTSIEERHTDRYGFYSHTEEGSLSSFHGCAPVESKLQKARNLKELERTQKWEGVLIDLEKTSLQGIIAARVKVRF